MKVHLLYKTTDGPWGGVNTFFRNFNKYSVSNKNLVIEENYSKSDIVLTTGHYLGPGKLLKKFQICNLSHGRWMNHPIGLIRRKGKGKRKIIIRVDGLREIYAKQSSVADESLKKNLAVADSVVFQSQFSKDCLDRLSLKYPDNHCIIHNGTDETVFFPALSGNSISDRIIVISNAWSVNLKKGFEMIARFSEIADVDVLHIGRWPENIHRKKVKLLGEMVEQDIAETLRKGHFFLSPSQYEACPNTVVEALACGLPVLYHNSGGTPELCRGESFGMAIPQDTASLSELSRFMKNAVDLFDKMRKKILDNKSIFGFENCIQKYVDHFQSIYRIQ